MSETSNNEQSIPGWFDWADWANETIANLPEGALYVEVGCFLGKSTCAIARLMQASPRKLSLHAVDTLEVPATADPELLRVVSEVTGGLRGFEKQLRANLRAAGVHKLVKVVKKTSLRAAEDYAAESVDVVFLDADHSYEAVKTDIAAWWQKLKPGGVLAGHDIHTYDSVWRAVTEWHEAITQPGNRQIALEIKGGQNIWVIRKPGEGQ